MTSKDNSECASRRLGNIPKPEKVREVSRDENAGAAIAAAKAQNVSLTSDGTKILNVIENSGKAVLTHDAGGE